MAKYCFLILFVGAALFSHLAAAAPPSETLLPSTTKGFLSVPDMDTLTAKWQETQLGQLVDDPVMKPFIDDLKVQIRSKLSKAQMRLGLNLEDLEGIAAGEVCLAAIQPGGDPAQHALTLLVDITGHHKEAAVAIEKTTKDLIAQGATKRTETVNGISVIVLTIPNRRPEKPAIEVYRVVHKDQLVVADRQQVLEGILKRLDGEQVGETLSQVEAFAAVMKRCAKESGAMKPHIRWFVEPFGYAHVLRAANGGRKRRGVDMLKILSHQGFTAIQGAGGLAFLATGDQEIVHYYFVFAPPVASTKDAADGQRYELAARMLNFPNSKTLQPQDWVFRDLGAYFSFNWKMADAFEYAKTMVNEMMGAKKGQDLFEDTIGSLAEDKDGPQIDLRKDLVRHFGERVSIITDCRRPITPDSERLMFAIELINPKAVRKNVNRAMENDPDAKKRIFNGTIIWEILTDDAPAEVEPLQIDGGGGYNPFAEEEEEFAAEDRDRVLPNSAITVVHGHLIVASNVDFIVELLQRKVGINRLADATDFITVQDALDKLGSQNDSFRFFTRTDEAYRTTYELIRQGKMPEAKTVLGKLLNRMLGPDEEGILREQQIDGSKMPDFDAVRRYLGPAGVYVRSEADGWYVTGCLLKKEMR